MPAAILRQGEPGGRPKPADSTMSEGNEIVVPPSFIALFVAPGRIKPSETGDTIAARYEMCEDLAQTLTEQALTKMFQVRVTEDDGLKPVLLGLRTGAVVTDDKHGGPFAAPKLLNPKPYPTSVALTAVIIYSHTGPPELTCTRPTFVTSIALPAIACRDGFIACWPGCDGYLLCLSAGALAWSARTILARRSRLFQRQGRSPRAPRPATIWRTLIEVSKVGGAAVAAGRRSRATYR
jgi:hypothetical protein